MLTKNVDSTRKGLVLVVAQELLKPSNKVTNLEIKNELRKKHSGYYWDQAFVSSTMDEYSTSGVFKYMDNGTFRTYFDPKRKMPTSKVVKAPAKVVAMKPTKTVKKVQSKDKWTTTSSISRKKAIDYMQNNKGHFFSAMFTKKDGSDRVINCRYLSGQDLNLGYVKVKETCLVRANDANPIRQINMQTLKKLAIGGNVYKIK